MRNVLLSLVLYVAAAQGALLTPSFGPGSYVELGPEVNHGIGHHADCFARWPCFTSDGSGRDLSVLPVFDSIEWFSEVVSTFIEPGNFLLDATTEIYSGIICHEPCPSPIPPGHTLGLSGLSHWNLNLLVHSPADGFIAYDHYVNGQYLGRVIQGASKGTVPLAHVAGANPFDLTRTEPGVTYGFLTQTEELRNIVWVPEPATYALTVLGLAALVVRRRFGPRETPLVN